jgi:uncharacterized protein
MAPVDRGGPLHVTVAYSPGPGVVDEVAVEVPAGATVADALRASGLLRQHPDIDLATQRVGVWGKLRAMDDALRERDRVEVYRALKVDPKEARRQRYRRHRDKA